MEDIRLLLVDDHDLVRQGLRALLHDAPGLKVVGEAADGVEGLEQAKRLSPDVVLMDLMMPTMDGAQATAAMAVLRPPPRVLALSGSGIDNKIYAALHAGALGYVSKAASREELLTAIARVDRGEMWMSADLTHRLLDYHSHQPPRPESLTQREVEILCWLARGMTNQQIADQAHLSHATVRTHLTNIFGKLGVGNRVEATLFALRDGLTTLDECLQSHL